MKIIEFTQGFCILRGIQSVVLQEANDQWEMEINYENKSSLKIGHANKEKAMNGYNKILEGLRNCEVEEYL